MHFSRYLNHWAKLRRDRPALLCDEAMLTWGAFNAQAVAVAGTLQAMGVRPGDRVGCLLENSIPWCVAYAATIHLDAVITPLNTAFGYVELREIVDDADCAVVVSTPRLVEKLGWTTDGLLADGVYLFDRRGGRSPLAFDEALKGQSAFDPPPYQTDAGLFGISYTSGTTGRPKGVMLTHQGVDAMCGALALGFDWTSEEKILLVAPLAFAGGFICNVAPMMRTGCAIRIERAFDPVRCLAFIQREGITYFGGVPALWQRLADAPGFAEADLSSLRGGSTGGAPVPEALLHAYLEKGVVIRQQYGCTEGGGGITLPDREGAIRQPGSCGFAIASLDLVLLDDDGTPTPEGEVGEICIRGPSLMAGYWNQPELTCASFAGDWYRTGDLGRIDADGLTVADRKKNMVISGGVNIYPAEVERVLSEAPGVAEIVVLGVPSEVWGEELVAIVRPGDAFDLSRLKAEARERLGRMKAPKRYAVTSEPLPRTATNKIQRQDLRQIFVGLIGLIGEPPIAEP